MFIFHVFYNILPTFSPFVNNSDVICDLAKERFVHITTIEAESLGEVYREMNHVDGTEHVSKLPVRSMSVGDVAYEIIGGKAYYCDSTGWKEMSELVARSFAVLSIKK